MSMPESKNPGNIRVKICGIGTQDDLIAARDAGADWVGLVFHPASPRHLDPAKAAAIRAAGERDAPGLTRVALTVDADDAALRGIIKTAAPHMLQCHGDESAERIAAIKSRFGLPVIKAIRISDSASLKAAAQYDAVADMLLFDSAPAAKGSPRYRPGGTGEKFDWALMRDWRGKLPWMLAGGLTAGNVAEAIAISGAKAVDVSSGVESAPGIKDHAAIMRFVMAARAGIR